MPMTCTICNHQDRGNIEAALAKGEPLRDIAKRTGTSHSAIDRHAKKCMGKALALAQEDRGKESGLNIMEELEAVNRESKAIVEKAKKGQDDRLVLLALDRICRQLELQARFLEVLQNTQSLRGAEQECTIVKALLADPEGAALAARLVERLGELDAGMGEEKR